MLPVPLNLTNSVPVEVSTLMTDVALVSALDLICRSAEGVAAVPIIMEPSALTAMLVPTPDSTLETTVVEAVAEVCATKSPFDVTVLLF